MHQVQEDLTKNRLCLYIAAAAAHFLIQKNSPRKTLPCSRGSKMEFCIGYHVLEVPAPEVLSMVMGERQLHLLALPLNISLSCTT